MHVRVDMSPDIMENNSTDFNCLKPGCVDRDHPAGRLRLAGKAALQFQPFRHNRRDTDIGGPGIEQKGYGPAVDAPVTDVMTLPIAFQFDAAFIRIHCADDIAVGVDLPFQQIAEQYRKQDQQQRPGEEGHQASEFVGVFLAHGCITVKVADYAIEAGLSDANARALQFQG